MPVLSNPKHERFCQERAKGETADHAYQLAGYTPSRHNAARLSTNETVRQRIAEVQEQRYQAMEARVGARLEITAELLMGQLEEVRDLAVKAGQHSAAVAAMKEIAVLAGVRIERSERTLRAEAPNELSDDVLLLELSSARTMLALPPPEENKDKAA